MRSHVAAVLAGLGALALAVAGTAVPATASPTPDPATRVTWSVEPSAAEGPDGRVSFRYELEPGGEVSDFVTVTNFSEQEVTFALYASDGVVTADGQFDLLPAAEEPVDVGTWITVEQPEVTIPALSQAIVPFTLTVPGDATPGDHPGGIVASLSTAGTDDQGNQVSVDNRVGARIHLRVAGDLAPELTVEDVSAAYHGGWNPFAAGWMSLDYTLTNTGNVRLGATQLAEVTGPFGFGLAGADGPEVAELLPGESMPVSLRVDDVWPALRVRAGVEGEPVVVGEDVVDVAPAFVSGGTGAWAVPWPQLGVLVVLGGAAYLLLLSRRRRAAQLAIAVAQAREEGAREAAAALAEPSRDPSS